MLLISCPWCGPRDESEFSCGGEAHIARPADPGALSDAEWADYLFARRNLHYPLFELFDRPALAGTCAHRKISTTAPQSLALLNSEFARNAAQRLSAHLTGKARSPRDRIVLCYQLTLARAPRPAELAAALELMAGAQNPLQGLADLSLAIFNLNEFLYID